MCVCCTCYVCMCVIATVVVSCIEHHVPGGHVVAVAILLSKLHAQLQQSIARRLTAFGNTTVVQQVLVLSVVHCCVACCCCAHQQRVQSPIGSNTSNDLKVYEKFRYALKKTADL